MNKDIAIILTARMGSSRLPGKAMMDINNKPLIFWILDRLARIGNVVLATTQDKSDDELAYRVGGMGYCVHRGETDDVISRMDNALIRYYPGAKYVLRGLGDCPFMSKELIDRSVEIMDRDVDVDSFAWALPPWVWPVYGAREFPYKRTAWNRIVKESKTREHVDVYFHENRNRFNTVYHEPPPNVYFRPYRLEVDWQNDADLISAIAKNVSMLAPTNEIVSFLDKHDEIAKLNSDRVEVTGPTTYSYDVKREWSKHMRGKNIVCWDDTIWNLPHKSDEPVFCNGGICLLGYAHDGTLHRTNGDEIRGNAMIKCKCGAGKRWISAK